MICLLISSLSCQRFRSEAKLLQIENTCLASSCLLLSSVVQGHDKAALCRRSCSSKLQPFAKSANGGYPKKNQMRGENLWLLTAAFQVDSTRRYKQFRGTCEHVISYSLQIEC